MRIDGLWVEDEGGVRRPYFLAKVETHSGDWIDCPFLVDTGADRTVFSAGVLKQLGRSTTLSPVQLGGVGGAVETMLVWTQIKFSNTDGTPIVVNGNYAAFTNPVALEESVLGRDIHNIFAVIVDRAGDTVCLLRDRHRYVIQET
jgi:predicted aspartyl protease